MSKAWQHEHMLASSLEAQALWSLAARSEYGTCEFVAWLDLCQRIHKTAALHRLTTSPLAVARLEVPTQAGKDPGMGHLQYFKSALSPVATQIIYRI